MKLSLAFILVALGACAQSQQPAAEGECYFRVEILDYRHDRGEEPMLELGRRFYALAAQGILTHPPEGRDGVIYAEYPCENQERILAELDAVSFPVSFERIGEEEWEDRPTQLLYEEG